MGMSWGHTYHCPGFTVAGFVELSVGKETSESSPEQAASCSFRCGRYRQTDKETDLGPS